MSNIFNQQNLFIDFCDYQEFIKPNSSWFQAWVYFYPSEDQQKACDNCGDQGMNGDLVIVYDVNRDTSLGDIKVQQEFISCNKIGKYKKNTIFTEIYIFCSLSFIFSYHSNFLLASPQEIRWVLCSSLCSI